MKRVLRLALGFALAGFVGGGVAVAADKPVKATPVTPAPVITWTGFYAGLQAGVTKVSSRLFNDSGDYTGTGFIGGGTLGYNWQIPNSIFVLGVEGDGSWSNAEARQESPFFCGPACQTKEHWLATIRGRLGVSWKRELFYITGGAAFVGFGQGQPGRYYNDLMSETGWAFGGGVESMIDAHWSWKFEYLYADFEQDKEIVNLTAPIPACPSPPGFSCSDYNRMHILRGGINYRF